MNAPAIGSRILCLAGISLLLGATPPASAVQLRVVVHNPYQVLTGSTVKVGHTVLASTNYNRLTAGGDFIVRCANPHTPLEVPGRRTISRETLLGGIDLTVTIPYEQPAYVNMPGFHALPRGTIVQCQYAWSARAVEGQYTIGAYGVGMTIGHGEEQQGGVADFHMRQPGTADGDDDACIP